MIVERKFVWISDHEYGPGFVPEGIENADPTFGMGAAHDLLEHFDDPSLPNGFEGEMLAFGAMHYVRGMNTALGVGAYGRTIFEGQASDLENFLRDAFVDRGDYRSPGEEALAKIEGYEGDYGFDTGEIRIYIRKALLARIKEDVQDDHGNSDGSRYAEVRRMYPRNFVDYTLGWMALGYELAQKRYASVSQYALTEAFQAASDAAEIALKGGDQGDYFTLRVVIGEGTAEAIRGNAYEDDWVDEEDQDEEELAEA